MRTSEQHQRRKWGLAIPRPRSARQAGSLSPGAAAPLQGLVPSIAVLRQAKEMSAALLLFYFGTICPKVEPQEWAASSRVSPILVSPPDNGKLAQQGQRYGREVI